MSLQKQFLGRASALLPWLEDSRVTDILINGPRELFIESEGSLRSVPSPFEDVASLLDLIERLVVPLGRRVDAAHPYLDGRLADGSRFHVILPPIAPSGPLLSIRKLRDASLCELESFGPREVVRWLEERLKRGKTMLIAGGTGAGKTTLLTRLLDGIDPSERIAILEECREIVTSHPHAFGLESRPPSPDGTGEVTLRALVRNALRMRPSRLVLGECRGEEAFDLLQAMNTGHAGSLCTLHANSARDALRRFEALALLGGPNAPVKTVREWIAGAVGLVVFVERAGAGRRISEILSIQGLEGDVYRIHPVYGGKLRVPRESILAAGEAMCHTATSF